jgi:hypothetical protein
VNAVSNSVPGNAGIPAGEDTWQINPGRSAGFQPALLLLRFCRVALFAIILVALTQMVQAHEPGLSTATVNLGPDKLEAVLVLSIRDLAPLVDLDKDRNGELSKEELAEGAAELQRTAGQALEVKLDGEPSRAAESRCRCDGNDNASVYLSFTVLSFSILVVRAAWLN